MSTTSTAVHACAQSLRESILLGKLPPGLRLPTERALAAQFNLHRSTVRSALAQLEAEHLVSARQGSGYTVHDFHREAGPDLIATLATLAHSAERIAIVRDLLTVRRHLARAVLEHFAEHSDGSGLDAFAEAIERFHQLAEKGASPADLARADLECIAELVAATKSTVLQLCLNPVASLLSRLPRLQRAMYRHPQDNVLAFRTVLAWARSKRHVGLDVILSELERRDEATLLALAKQRSR
jgi:GntR family transcriptional regulator, transcriptional repressor for pyruvate dehydrogenase complex